MVTIQAPESTTFSLDILGRYSCNTLDEALDSQRTDLPDQADARPFDFVVVGGGSFGAVVAARLFNLDVSHRVRILVLEAGPLVLSEHVQNLPPDFSPPGKNQPGTVWGQPWASDSPRSFNATSRAWPSASAAAHCSGAAGRPTSSTLRWPIRSGPLASSRI